MADNKDVNPNKTNNGASAPSTGSSGLALFLSLLSLVAIVVLVCVAYYFQKQLLSLQEQTQADKQAVNTLLSQAKESVEKFEAIRDANVKENETLKTLQQELERSQADFITLRGNRDWVLSEVKYLVFMANERLQSAKDIATAAAQLKVADDRLSTLADPSLSKVKAAIANDMAKLINTEQVDKQALWAEVGSLSDLIAKLQFKTLGASQKTEEINATGLSSWQTALHQSWDEIKDLIKITRIEENPIPLSFTQAEQAQIFRTLQLLNEQAQWAVLQGDSKVYLDSLSMLDKYTKLYFAENTDQTTLLKRIQQLQQQNVHMTTPDITDSLKALSQATTSKKE